MRPVTQLPPRRPPPPAQPMAGDRRDILGAIVAGAGMILALEGVFVLPSPDWPFAFAVVGLGAVGLAFAGMFGLFLDRTHRKLAGGFFIAAGGLLAFGSPFVRHGVTGTRLLLAYGVPAALLLAGGALLLRAHLRPLRRVA